MKNSTSQKRNIELDRLRAAAVLLLIWHHIIQFIPVPVNIIPSKLTTTWSGVELFFVISGFIVSSTVVPRMNFALAITPKLERRSALFAVIRAFFIRRVFRLLPLVFATVLFYLALNVSSRLLMHHLHIFNSDVFGPIDKVFQEVTSILTLTYNFNIINGGPHSLGWFWSLSIEEQFYLLFPVFIIVFPADKMRLFLAIIYFTVITAVIRPFFTPEGTIDSDYVRYSSHLKFDSIMAGCAIYFISVKCKAMKIPTILSKPVTASIISGFLIVCLGLVPGFISSAPLGHFLINIISIKLVFLASLRKNLVLPVRPLEGILNWFGRRSYTLYLVQQPVLSASFVFWFIVIRIFYFESSFVFSFLTLTFALIFGFLVTELLFYLVEKPMIRLGHKISDHLENKVLRETQ